MKMQTISFYLMLFLFSPIVATGNALSDTDPLASDSLNTEKGVAELFRSTDILDIILMVDDMKALQEDVGENPSYHQGLLTYINEQGEPVDLDIKVQARGNYRKDPANCNFPPLRVNFKRREVSNTVFEGQNKLKLVTHCRKRSDDFTQYVLKEYLAYRIYNILTDRSFQVRLAKITYIDGKGKYDPLERYAFFIEDTKDMADRNGFTHVKVSNIPQQYTDYFYQDLLTIFQYFIGNTDWSVPGRHNIKLIQDEPDHRPVPVPYDFDWTGLVNPVYAKPSPKLGIKTVKERLFRGYEKDPEEFERVFKLFEDKKAEIYALLDECPLEEKHKKRVSRYLDDFYIVINDERLIHREFVVNAREPESEYWGK